MGIPVTDEVIQDCRNEFGDNYDMFTSWLLLWSTEEDIHIEPCTKEKYLSFPVTINQEKQL